MKKDLINAMQNSYSTYKLNDDTDLPDRILNYLIDRVEANRNEIEKIISIYKSTITVDQIINIIKEELNNNPKSIGKTIIDKNGFMFAQVMDSVGILAVRAYAPIQIISYWAKAIKTKNVVAIVSKNYSEYSIEALILLIIKEALNKFNVDENLVMYFPEDELQYVLFDKVIYTCGKDGKIFESPQSQDMSKLSDNTNKKFVYIENEELRAEAEKNKDAVFITGDIDKAISYVKDAKAAVIYTKDSNKAYKFINLAKADNVFVNTNVQNAFETISSGDELFKYKNIIIPVPKDFLNRTENTKNDVVNKNENTTKVSFDNENKQGNSNNMMVEYKENLWTKIKKALKDLFK